MIKVIKHGNKKIVKCEECGCVFSYEKEDVEVEQTGVNEYFSYVVCPDCTQKKQLN